MQPNRAAKRTDRGNATDLAKHNYEARSREFLCQSLFRPAFGANAPLP
jgi:hypothetical protein